MRIVDEKGFLDEEKLKWLIKFTEERHMKWDDTKLTGNGGLWNSTNYGENGSLYTYPHIISFSKEISQDGIINSNVPAEGIPTLYFPYGIANDQIEYGKNASIELILDNYEMETNKVFLWLNTLYEKVLKPVGMYLEGEDEIFNAECEDDFAKIIADKDGVHYFAGERFYSLSELKNKPLLEEIERRLDDGEFMLELRSVLRRRNRKTNKWFRRIRKK